MSDIQHDYYTLYCSIHDTSLILSSSDRINFRVHPVVLRMASGVFRDMLNGAMDTGEVVELQEKGDVLKGLLDIIHPNGSSIYFDGRSIDFVWALLQAADKYDMQKITEEIRVCLPIDTYFQSYPLESYTIACRYGWKKEIKHFTGVALDNLNTPRSPAILTHLNAMDIIRLEKLLAMRKSFIATKLKTSGINWPHRYGYASTINSDLLLSLVEKELEKHPSGKTLQAPSAFWRRDEVKYIASESTAAEKIHKIFNEYLKQMPSQIDDVSFVS